MDVDMSAVRRLTADHRRRAADLIEGLTPEQLAAPSLCGTWTVHEVAAHLLMPLVTPFRRIMATMARSGFDWDKANVRLTAEVAKRPVPDIARGLRERAEHPFKPPGGTHLAPLTDVLIHLQDIRRPLGLGRDLDAESLRLALAYAVSGKAIGVVPKGREAGLRFEATDLDWRHGDGSLVRGPGEAILLALSGRRVALDDLEGEGVAQLRSRLDD